MTDYSVITCILLIVLLTMLIYAIQIKFRYEKFTFFGYLKTIEIVTRSLLATSNTFLPQTFHMRFSLGFWLFGCIFINAYVQTNFMVAMTKPAINDEISNHKQLLKSDLNKTIGIA